MMLAAIRDTGTLRVLVEAEFASAYHVWLLSAGLNGQIADSPEDSNPSKTLIAKTQLRACRVHVTKEG
ncbi:hypothetical protein Rhe02_84130 [Rhizocola hellebori]|uniref:Uncharacterized protein n=1 Tax=Rhizocola hellebori TaxID=1392758 RepID=A0A8J3VLQ7_9ACTN|nr:hypothetical protein Rhe02_84130 [Rhizocola hellebori]